MKFPVLRALLLCAIFPAFSLAQTVAHTCQSVDIPHGVRLEMDDGVLEIEALRANILRIDVQPKGKISPRTLVMDPRLKGMSDVPASILRNGDTTELKSTGIRVTITCAPHNTISIADASGRKLVEQEDPFVQASGHNLNLLHTAAENIYGISGLSMRENGGSLLRNNGSEVSAGAQGEAGAPWFFTTHYGVLIDSDGGGFDTRDNQVRFWGNSRTDLEYFVIAGRPMQLIAGLADLTGRPPMPPKWTLGFLNSQWGSTEAELRELTSTYRAKHIPLDGFILDFDWKAWGEDNYGEWRWNSTAGPENQNPNKFPNGASGKFAKDLLAQGVHLSGILKPRILVYKKGSTTEMHEAAAYAEEHKLWVPNRDGYTDYFAGQTSRDIDFSKPEARSWYWKHLEPAFDTGMVGWWNDEADNTNNFQFVNMGRALYDGQRNHSDVRVWSLNRNYYLGADRYGYAEWSGDIQTGFGTMAHQRMRMLATLDVGEPHWSMDTGGFFGHPTPENYARWMEFAAFVPIDRVHGDLGEKRQPWVYGPVAEAAATKALRLRYALLPYIYSYEHAATETGVGLVRPLFWAFPDDPKVANEGASWMFGDSFLVSPVVAAGETEHSLYLPEGTWFDYFHGTRYQGGKTVSYAVDAHTWQDIPLFVRAGSIIASQPPQDYTSQTQISEVTLDVFPAAQTAHFAYYDDDGNTYAYEKGEYYRQEIEASQAEGKTRVLLAKPTGSFTPALHTWLIRVHGGSVVSAVLVNGKALTRGQQLDGSNTGEAWNSDRDKFGPVTTIRIAAQQSSSIEIR